MGVEMRSTGPILAIGAITLVNETIVNGQPIDWKVPVATGIAAAMFSLLEHAWPPGAVALAWTALVTLLITRVKPNVPAPAESLVKWMGY